MPNIPSLLLSITFTLARSRSLRRLSELTGAVCARIRNSALSTGTTGTTGTTVRPDPTYTLKIMKKSKKKFRFYLFNILSRNNRSRLTWHFPIWLTTTRINWIKNYTKKKDQVRCWTKNGLKKKFYTPRHPKHGIFTLWQIFGNKPSMALFRRKLKTGCHHGYNIWLRMLTQFDTGVRGS